MRHSHVAALQTCLILAKWRHKLHHAQGQQSKMKWQVASGVAKKSSSSNSSSGKHNGRILWQVLEAEKYGLIYLRHN